MNLKSVPVNTLCLFLEAVGAHPHESLSVIARYTNKSVSTARRALPVLQELGLVRNDESGRYVTDTAQIDRGASATDLRQVIRKALFTFRPFEVICEGIALGESEPDSIRKSMVLLGIDSQDRSSMETLIRWGEELEILSRDNGRLILSEDVDFARDPIGLGLPTPDDVSSEARARLYNSSRLGVDAHNYLDEVDRGLLADALIKAGTEPEQSLEASGKVVENFLREVAADKRLSTEASKQSGAGQLAAMLRSHDVIHSHHIHLVQAIATLRNSQGHSKDKTTKEVWQTDSRTAYWSAHGALVTIRSIYSFVFENKHIV